MTVKPMYNERTNHSDHTDNPGQGNDPFSTRLHDLNRGFFQGVARLVHDLNSPLTALQTAMDLLEQELKSEHPGAAHSELELALSSLGNVGQLISSWQDALHLDAPAYTHLDALSTTYEVIERIRASHPKLSVEIFHSESSEADWMIDAEPFGFEQIIALLLQNAVEATEAIGSPQITLQLEQSPQELILIIDNNGRTIPDDIKTTLWKDFVTTKEGHFGLGLGIVRYLLMRHGGSIQLIQSKLGGTAFKMTMRRKMRQMMSF